MIVGHTAKSVLLAPGSLAGSQPQGNLWMCWSHAFSCSISPFGNNQRNASLVWLLEFLCTSWCIPRPRCVMYCSSKGSLSRFSFLRLIWGWRWLVVFHHLFPVYQTLVNSAADGGSRQQCPCFWDWPLPRLGSAALHGAVERSQRQKESFNNCVYLFKNAWILDSCALAPESKEEQRGFAC